MLKVECESCKAPYQVDERRVPPTGLKMRCPKCGHSFMVTDPSKGASGAGAAAPAKSPPPKKATMVGVGLFGADGAPPSPSAGAIGLPAPSLRPPPKPLAPPPPKAAAPLLDLDDDLALPTVKAAAPKLAPPKLAPPKAPPNPTVGMPGLGDLDLPALAGDAGLPVAVSRPKPKGPVIAKKAPPKPAPGGAPSLAAPPPPPRATGGQSFNFDMDLPGSLPPPPRAGAGAGGAIGFELDAPLGGLDDLPSTKEADLPSSKDFGALDLPSPRPFGALDLPSPKSGGGGFDGGFDDLPMLQNDLPVVGGGLPSPKSVGGGGFGGGGFGEIDLPSVQNDLPSLQNDLPAPMGLGAQLPSLGGNLPSPLGLDAHLPSPMRGDAHLPMPMDGDRLLPSPHGGSGGGVMGGGFGELDLPSMAPGPGDGIGFGELDLPSGGVPPAGTMASFGEVDLGGDTNAPPAMGPPIAASAGNVMGQEASLEPQSAAAPQRQTRVSTERGPSRVPKILALVAAALVVGGAALQFTSVGAFGHLAIGDAIHAKDYVTIAEQAADSARPKVMSDIFSVSQGVADDVAEARRRAPRSRPLAAYACFIEHANQVRFGLDTERAARARTFLADIPPGTNVPFLVAAQAAVEATNGDWQKAKVAVDDAIGQETNPGIQQDLTVLKGEIALAMRDAPAALAIFEPLAKTAPSARVHFGIARAAFIAKNLPKSKDAVEATLKATPTHAGALTLRALLTWELQRDDTASLKDLAAVLDPAARRREGPSEISSALAAKGRIMLAREHASEARAAFDEAVRVDPRNATALIGQGEVLYADGRFTEALTRFGEAVAKEPTNLQAVIGDAKTKIALENLAGAKTELIAARAKAPKDSALALWLAKTEESLGNKPDADKLFNAAVDLADPQNPDAVTAYAAYARFLAAQGKTAESQAKLEQAKTKLPDSASLQRMFGEIAASQGEFAEAVSHFEAALQKNPADIGTRFRLGVTYRKQGKLELAAQELNQVVATDKEFPGIALERGALFEQSGDVKTALDEFNTALQKAPNDVDLKLRVAAAYVSIGDVDKALPLLNQVKEQRPNSAEANHLLGRAYLKQGGAEAAAAMRYLQRAVEIDPNRAEYHLYVAWAANDAGGAQLGLARTHVDKALALDKLLADAYWQRGVVELRSGELNDAQKDLKHALELKPQRHEAHATLAEVYEQKNDTAAAMGEWAKAIAGDDKQATWRYRYGKLLAEKGQTAEAAKHLGFAVTSGKDMQPRPGWLGPASFEAAEALRKSGSKKEACDDYHLYMELAAPTSPDRRDAVSAMTSLGCPWEDR